MENYNEPWALTRSSDGVWKINIGDEKYITIPDAAGEGTARRIAGCVNFLAGVPTINLESKKTLMDYDSDTLKILVEAWRHQADFL